MTKPVWPANGAPMISCLMVVSSVVIVAVIRQRGYELKNTISSLQQPLIYIKKEVYDMYWLVIYTDGQQEVIKAEDFYEIHTWVDCNNVIGVIRIKEDCNKEITNAV